MQVAYHHQQDEQQQTQHQQHVSMRSERFARRKEFIRAVFYANYMKPEEAHGWIHVVIFVPSQRCEEFSNIFVGFPDIVMAPRRKGDYGNSQDVDETPLYGPMEHVVEQVREMATDGLVASVRIRYV